MKNKTKADLCLTYVHYLHYLASVWELIITGPGLELYTEVRKDFTILDKVPNRFHILHYAKQVDPNPNFPYT